jgi:hypothetical protein
VRRDETTDVTPKAEKRLAGFIDQKSGVIHFEGTEIVDHRLAKFCHFVLSVICIYALYIYAYIYIVKKQNSSPFRIEWVVVQGSYLIRFLNAQVVSIFKKGDTENIANYRPISLLNAIYKIFAEIIRQRLSDVIDPYICNTQLGSEKTVPPRTRYS